MPEPRRWWALPFLSAVLFWASFHPLNLGFLAWIALVPLLVYARSAPGKAWFFVTWLAGALAFGAGFEWVRYTVPAGPIFLGAYMGLYVAVFTALVRKLGLAWAPVAWVGLEYVRGSFLFGGLPWFLLGYTQHECPRLIQLADVGGVWGVSLLVAFVNAAIVDGRRAMRWGAAATLVAAWAYGLVRMETLTIEEGPRIAVVQPNIPQDIKKLSLESPDQAMENYRKHMDLTTRAAAEKPDLIVWPEAAIYEPVPWDVRRSRWVETAWFRNAMEPAAASGARALVGLLVAEIAAGKDGADFTNSALYVSPDRAVLGRYDKVHLVPFSEFIPLAARFPQIRTLVERYSGLYLSDMRPGTDFPVWDLGGTRFGVQICFEGIFPEISRRFARKGAAFTVNISNDGWFRSSAELDQMLAMARFRAVESRIGFVRATNTGISAFVDPAGRVTAAIPGKETEGTLVEKVRWTRAGSPARSWGDWLGWLSALALVVGPAGRFFVDRVWRRA